MSVRRLERIQSNLIACHIGGISCLRPYPQTLHTAIGKQVFLRAGERKGSYPAATLSIYGKEIKNSG